MGGPSYKARRPQSAKEAASSVGEKCPQCGEGVIVKVDDNFLSCDSCGFDIPILKEENDVGGSNQGET